jgi:hypothetical protein
MQIGHRENIDDKSVILRAMQAALPPNAIISGMRLSPANWLVVSVQCVEIGAMELYSFQFSLLCHDLFGNCLLSCLYICLFVCLFVFFFF